ncbi:MAG: MmcQ/YjbR family DNA-binding protein [Phenylobacterium sp.]|uniref:MmcQ/YjbR family DNA-binding protein n=1 Tax=Phenylobacterium sp. TaxID=1871053 RepID=UPI002728177C|nr:MmcQ/YjbR family DNA-binding protein [Phenylobacterium sp.]MDO8913013.1 MmcQ/YjbR family DNA-binding protein [Phenylobacterium sp.]MDP3101059.1 MmcQ/YjbR family DNA-binding protein [Phenylobacterium sp.]
MPTPHQQAEAALTAYALSLPETDLAPGWGETRYLRVRGKGFAVFGDKAQASDALTLTVKLPISYEMVQDLPFMRQGSPWYRENRWAISHFGPEDDILAELDTLKGWVRQSYVAMAPRALSRLLTETGA